jgi:hypothetical protein
MAHSASAWDWLRIGQFRDLRPILSRHLYAACGGSRTLRRAIIASTSVEYLVPHSQRGASAWPEYERNGVANLFMMFAPLEGWRRVKITDRHAAGDYAQVLKELSDVHFPDAEKIRLVQDNLRRSFWPYELCLTRSRFSTHSAGCILASTGVRTCTSITIAAINHLPDSDNSELVVPLKVAKKKGWAA